MIIDSLKKLERDCSFELLDRHRGLQSARRLCRDQLSRSRSPLVDRSNQSFSFVHWSCLPTMKSMFHADHFMSRLVLTQSQLFKMSTPALTFQVTHRCDTTKARVARLTLGRQHTSRGPIDTPVFMPVGTQGTLKGLTPEQLHQLNCRIILGNTYHLGHRPVSSSILDSVSSTLFHLRRALSFWHTWVACIHSCTGTEAY